MMQNGKRDASGNLIRYNLKDLMTDYVETICSKAKDGKVTKVEDYNGRRSLRVTLSNKKQIDENLFINNPNYYLYYKTND